MDWLTLDGNEAVARVAYALSEALAIYPITPASPMGEHADVWAARGRKNLWGAVPRVVEMQSEAGAAGAVHGLAQGGALAATFTASQGLLLMVPEMFKLAGELNPCVFHVATRALAVQALSIFCSHDDLMAVRHTGFAILVSASVQEAQDLAAIAHCAALEGRLPVVHAFDGFRTSHEVARIQALTEAQLAALVDERAVRAHRVRALSPEHPVLRGSSQNPDVYFQGRERVEPVYTAFPAALAGVMERFAQITGRRYRPFEYHGHPEAERVVVLMGSGVETAVETAEALNDQGARVGVLQVRLFRPWRGEALVEALPRTTRRVMVLDRCKEPGAEGEPLFKDVALAIARHGAERFAVPPQVVGGRYGLGSKEFTPGMVKQVFDELARPHPRDALAVGVWDDLTDRGLPGDPAWRNPRAREGVHQAVFYGLGSDGTVSANRATIRLIGDALGCHVQGYFVYDSKKSGAMTVSHLRFGPRPIRSRYLIGDGEADFVACHQPRFLERLDCLRHAAPGATVLLNANPEGLWERLARTHQRRILEGGLALYAVDAAAIARRHGLGGRINTAMQGAYFALAGLLPLEEALARLEDFIRDRYGRRGRAMAEANVRALREGAAAVRRVDPPGEVTATFDLRPPVPEDAPPFVQRFTARLIQGEGDRLPVSALPEDGSFPLGTAAWEKRNLAEAIPVWEPDLCVQCGKCVFVCPHAAIRAKLYPAEALGEAPPGFKSAPVKGADYPRDHRVTYQVAPEDCTGCTLCVDACPIHDPAHHARKALNMAPQAPLRAQEAACWRHFLRLPEARPTPHQRGSVKGAMFLRPLFEFPGACAGCGETPYLRLASQLFGERMVVANATGCSSIYGGNLPTTPWAADDGGRGPAWSNSLFEDNAEFGYGLRLAHEHQAGQARDLLRQLAPRLPAELVEAALEAPQREMEEIAAQRARLRALAARLETLDDARAERLLPLLEHLLRRSVWLVGGDGWAYDIGFAGLDHVLASKADVNILVLDTEVYSNTGGQTSKATPLGAVAKFSSAGKAIPKKDLARHAMDYGHVYVAQVAYGAKDTHTLRVFQEADAYPGPSLILAYAPCIAHGYDLAHNHRQQRLAVLSGHWPLLRYDPRRAQKGENPLHLDSPPPSVPYAEFARGEARFRQLSYSHPQRAKALIARAEAEARARYRYLEQIAHLAWQEEAQAWQNSVPDTWA